MVGGPDVPGSLLSPATVNRILAAVSSFYDWAVVAEEYDGDSPMQKRLDPALARMPDRHQPFMGRASRQQPTRRTVTVKQPRRLPRPLDEAVLEQFIGSLKRLRDLAVFLLMLDGGLRPGEVLSLHLDDISYGRRRVTVRKRDEYRLRCLAVRQVLRHLEHRHQRQAPRDQPDGPVLPKASANSSSGNSSPSRSRTATGNGTCRP